MRLCALILMLVALAAGAERAHAQRSMVVLGLRSVEGDDAVALNLSSALRKAGGEVPDWLVRDQAVSLSQMVLVHGCEMVDNTCLAAIAKGLNVDLVVYGELRRDQLVEDHGYEAELHLFDASSSAVEGSALRAFAASETDEAGLEQVGKELITQVNPDSPHSLPPSLTIESNVADAEVRLNGQVVGTIQDGALRLTGLDPGMYNVEVAAEGYKMGARTVELLPGEATLLELPLLSADQATAYAADQGWVGENLKPGPSIPTWLPYGLFGVSAAALAGVITSWVVIDNVANDSLYLDYRAAQAGVSDVCVTAEQGVPDGLPASNPGRFDAGDLKDIVNMCDRASTYEVLQYVFGGVAIASAAAGGILLYLSMKEQAAATTPGPAEARSNTQRFRIQPTFSRNYGGLAATLRF